MPRSVPFGALDVMGRSIMALVAITGGDSARNKIRVAQRVGMFAPRSMTVFALDVGNVNQRRKVSLHTFPDAIGLNRREGPTNLRSHIIKSAVFALATSSRVGSFGLTRPLCM